MKLAIILVLFLATSITHATTLTFSNGYASKEFGEVALTSILKNQDDKVTLFIKGKKSSNGRGPFCAIYGLNHLEATKYAELIANGVVNEIKCTTLNEQGYNEGRVHRPTNYIFTISAKKVSPYVQTPILKPIPK